MGASEQGHRSSRETRQVSPGVFEVVEKRFFLIQYVDERAKQPRSTEGFRSDRILARASGVQIGESVRVGRETPFALRRMKKGAVLPGGGEMDDKKLLEVGDECLKESSSTYSRK